MVFQRGLYCRILGHRERFLADILRGDERATKENLRVNPNSLRRIIQLCSDVPKRSGWTLDVYVSKGDKLRVKFKPC